MSKRRLEVRAETRQFDRLVDLYVGEFDECGYVRMVAEPVVLRTIEDGEIIPDPTVSLRREAAQRLMDELWRCGLRPTEGSGSAGSLAATERHLKDMQAIAMGLLRKDGVQP